MWGDAVDRGGIIRFHRRKEGSLLFLCGGSMVALALIMIPSFTVSILRGEDLAIMGVPMIVGLVIGTPLVMRYRLAAVVRPPDALAMMGVLWISCFLFGMLPFLMGGMSLVDALFESASGFTTTGVDAISNFTDYPYCILFWRSTTTWVGGILVILIFMLLMPMVGGGTRSALANETSGSSEAYNRTMRLRDTALQFISVYVILTFVMSFILMALSYTPYESITLAFSTVSAGGFMVAPVEFTQTLKVIIMIFMFLGATNFYLHFRALYQRDLSVYRKSEEFMGTLFWCLLMSIVLFYLLNPDIGGDNMFERYLDSLFMTVSAASTSGFSYEDFGTWHYSAMVVLYLMAFIGASSGSTAGGIKIHRLIMCAKIIFRSFSHVVRPNSINDITMDGNKVPNETVRNTMMVIMLFIVTVIGFSLLLMVLGYNGTESVSCSIAMISNFGSAVGQFGPSAGYAAAPDFLKLILIVMMWIGRLEVLVGLAILSPRIWKEQIRNTKDKRRKWSVKCMEE